MPSTSINGKDVQIDAEGFMTVPSEWDEGIAAVLAGNIGVELTEAHWRIIRFLREDFAAQGETATTRRVQTVGGFPTKEQFELFPKK
ncbi:MAG TPA: TusE/DsrC/DsvC family sulfur relay protein, partial [Actinotalea sp.]|nr:TusE/DsrC/DsvC family sulfur relay protein [Actinotalea sp.]